MAIFTNLKMSKVLMLIYWHETPLKLNLLTFSQSGHSAERVTSHFQKYFITYLHIFSFRKIYIYFFAMVMVH